MLISVQRARSLRNSCLGTPANVLIDIVLKDVTKSRRRAPLTALPAKQHSSSPIVLRSTRLSNNHLFFPAPDVAHIIRSTF